jgi:hypothetical protein
LQTQSVLLNTFFHQGLPDFWYNIPKSENVPDDHKIYWTAVKFTKWSEILTKSA